jgi:aspartyl-tRNA(Asn)/glutamyl-tRNA(Gln) amidotransferase subunit A
MIDLDLLSQDLTLHIELIRSKQVSAEELAQLQFERVKQLNPQINAFISYKEPKVPANAGESLLQGACLAIKDNIDLLGFSTTAGMATRKNNTAKHDAFVVDRLRHAGASFIGKLNMHEGALGATNHNPYFGDCYNPHKEGYTPGGSSGGSAAAVAAGIVAVSLGTDTMGSVRIPASYCGIFGFKPSRGAVSNRGTVACSRVMDNIGPMARSARDLTKLFKAMACFDAKSAESVDYHFEQPVIVDDKQLFVPENLAELGVEQDIIDDFESNLAVFKDLDYQIETFSFGQYDFAAARRAGLLLCEADMRLEHSDDWEHNPGGFSDYMRAMLGFVDSKHPLDIVASELVLDNAVTFARTLIQPGQFLLMPTTPQRAFPMSAPVPAGQADLTSFANQAGLPALSIPMITQEALPAGMQLVGTQGSDFTLLKIAEAWQRESEFIYQLPI